MKEYAMHPKYPHAFAALAMLAGVAAPATAATYDAFSTFNGTQNAGNFTYGSVDDAVTGGTLFTANTNCFIAGSICLQAAANYDVPGATKSTTTSVQYGGVTVPNDRLLLHPGPTAADGGVFITFTAPTTATYSYIASFSVQDSGASGTTEIFRLQSGAAPATFFGSGSLSLASPTYSHSGSIFLNSGDVFSTIINREGSYSNDSTGENFTLSTGAVPEPATWGLMIVGFGLVGSSLRSRRKQTVRVTYS
jgi:hypothetical protein